MSHVEDYTQALVPRLDGRLSWTLRLCRKSETLFLLDAEETLLGSIKNGTTALRAIAREQNTSLAPSSLTIAATVPGQHWVVFFADRWVYLHNPLGAVVGISAHRDRVMTDLLAPRAA